MKPNIKLGARYVVLTFFMFLAYKITGTEWITGIGDVDSTVMSVIYGSVFGALTLVLKSHFETKISNDS